MSGLRYRDKSNEKHQEQNYLYHFPILKNLNLFITMKAIELKWGKDC